MRRLLGVVLFSAVATAANAQAVCNYPQSCELQNIHTSVDRGSLVVSVICASKQGGPKIYSGVVVGRASSVHEKGTFLGWLEPNSVKVETWAEEKMVCRNK